jgi:hypothetical protein
MADIRLYEVEIVGVTTYVQLFSALVKMMLLHVSVCTYVWINSGCVIY